MIPSAVCVAFLSFSAPVAAPAVPSRAGANSVDTTPPELGRVHFGRDIDSGLKSAADSGKPAFVVFQEIPGCATCRAFGAGPLSHPLMVEAIEDLFTPIAVHNNKGGADALALARFHEPSWNNPVVRFLASDGTDLIPREDGVWSAGGIATRMGLALERAKRPIPRWFELARLELSDGATASTRRAVFAMHCFWEGQAALGGLDGVVDARPAFYEGAEVVVVDYRVARISTAALVRAANGLDCALKVWTSDAADLETAKAIVGARAARLDGSVRAAKPDDDLRHVHGALTLVPMTRVQALRVNAALAREKNFDDVLSPKQRALRASIETALATKPAVFAGLSRPDDSAQLPTFEDELRARLARAH